jgi:uncharacterized surface protein with fasciclin (FAS1) repeats
MWAAPSVVSVAKRADVPAGNGIIHVVDKVLLPSE